MQDDICSKEPDDFSIDDLSTVFISACNYSAIEERKNISKPWFDKDCYQQNGKLKSALRTGCNQIISTDKQLFKKICRNKRRLYDLHRENSIIETAETDRSQFRNILQSKRTKVVTPNVQDDAWKTLFQNFLYVKNSKTGIVIDLTQQTSIDDKLDAEITEEELTHVADKIKPNKAPGSDGISINRVKSNLFVLLPLVLQQFSSNFSQVVIPKFWIISLLKPLYKNKGDEKNPDNYRELALGNSIFKLFTSVLQGRLLS